MASTPMGITQEELAEQAHAVWSAIRAAAYAVSDEQIDRPNTFGTWTGRDVMVHIANWEEVQSQRIRDLDAGKPLEPLYTTDEELDAWNEAHVAPYHDVPLAEAKRYFERCHEELMATVLSSPNVHAERVMGCYPNHLDDLLELRWR